MKKVTLKTELGKLHDGEEFQRRQGGVLYKVIDKNKKITTFTSLNSEKSFVRKNKLTVFKIL